MAKQLLPPSPQKDHLPVKISHPKDGKNKTIKKSAQFVSAGGALEADEAPTAGS